MNVLGREIGIATLGSIGAAVVIAIAGAIFAALAGWFELFTKWLISPVNVPIWLVVLVLVTVTVSLGVHGVQWRRRRSSPLTSNEKKVMDVLAVMHPNRPTARQLAVAIGSSSVMAEAAVSSLIDRGYISFPLSLYGETTYYLIGDGLDYIAKRKA